MSSLLHPDVLSQMGFTLRRDRPLIVSDVDEVLVRFIRGMEDYLAERGLYYDWKHYDFDGTIRRRADETLVTRDEMMQIHDGFLRDRLEHLEPVPGGAEALIALSERAQIVILTNLPAQATEQRRRGLEKLGLRHPIIANVGGKGPAMRHLAGLVEAPTFFLDDLPSHHASVAVASPNTTRVHFVDDERLVKLMGVADSHHRTDQWPVARAFIEDRLSDAGF
jgi:hypothetical protein